MELRSLAIRHARLPAARVRSITLRMEGHVPIAMAFAFPEKNQSTARRGRYLRFLPVVSTCETCMRCLGRMLHTI